MWCHGPRRILAPLPVPGPLIRHLALGLRGFLARFRPQPRYGRVGAGFRRFRGPGRRPRARICGSRPPPGLRRTRIRPNRASRRNSSKPTSRRPAFEPRGAASARELRPGARAGGPKTSGAGLVLARTSPPDTVSAGRRSARCESGKAGVRSCTDPMLDPGRGGESAAIPSLVCPAATFLRTCGTAAPDWRSGSAPARAQLGHSRWTCLVPPPILPE